MRVLRELSSENECCRVEDKVDYMLQIFFGMAVTYWTALIMNNIMTKFHTKARMGPAGNTTGRWCVGDGVVVQEGVVMVGRKGNDALTFLHTSAYFCIPLNVYRAT